MDVIGGNEVADAFPVGKTLDAEAVPVDPRCIDIVDIERAIWRRRRECGLLLEEIEDVVMRNVSGGRHGAVVVGYRLGGVDEGTVGGEGESSLPEMQACGPVRAKTGGDGKLCRGELGRVDPRGRNGEIDHEKSIRLLRRRGSVIESRDRRRL